MASAKAPRYALAIFDDWRLLVETASLLSQKFHAELAALASATAFTDAPRVTGDRDVELWCTLSTTMTLQFKSHTVACSIGALSNKLSRQLARSAADLAETLSMWMPPKQGRRLAAEIGEGKLLLWVRLMPHELERPVCEALLQARPIRVELHDLTPLPI